MQCLKCFQTSLHAISKQQREKNALRLQLKIPIVLRNFMREKNEMNFLTNRHVIVQLTIQNCFALNHARKMCDRNFARQVKYLA